MIVFRNKNPNPFASSESVGRTEKSIAHFSTHYVRSKRTGVGEGFTLIEVLLAMAIIGLILTPIFAIQLGVLRSNSRASQTLARIFAGKQFLVDNEFQLKPDDQEKRIEKKLERPPTTLTYELKRIPENSALKKFKNVLIENVIMQWVDRQGKTRQERLATFVFKPEVKT